MRERAATPGPWSIAGRYGLNKLEVAGPDGNAIASVWAFKPGANDKPQGREDYVEDPQGQANAALIAAAPEREEELGLLRAAFHAADTAVRQSSSIEAGVAWAEARNAYMRWRNQK